MGNRAEPGPGPAAFFREAGSGPSVVCLHSNASSSGQWRALMERLAPGFRVLAPDSYGAGKSPAWPTERPVRLSDEAALLEAAFARAGDPFALVGHSYGAAVALIAAVAQPHRVRALAFYEPAPLEAFAALDVPVLYMTGKNSPASSTGVARLLTRVLPRVEVVQFEGLGHMGPVTHPEVVNEAISRFLERSGVKQESGF